MIRGTAGITVLNLFDTKVTDASSIGTVIGNFSVSGSTRAYVFSLTSNPGGLFSVSGSTLAVASALTEGIAPISASAIAVGAPTITGSFNITVGSSILLTDQFGVLLTDGSGALLTQ